MTGHCPADRPFTKPRHIVIKQPVEDGTDHRQGPCSGLRQRNILNSCCVRKIFWIPDTEGSQLGMAF